MLSVYLDDLELPALVVEIDLAELLSLDEGQAWVGFTAAAGGANQNHDILNWTFDVGSTDCQGDTVPDDCQLVGNDCNLTGFPDDCELEGNDVNGNERPDECDDCNGNGVLDDEDVATGTSEDLNGNGIPDECESLLVVELVKPCGRFFITSEGNPDAVRAYYRSGESASVHLQGEVLSAAGTLAFGPDRELLISQRDTDNVLRLGPNGELVGTISGGGLNGTHGVAVTPENNLAVCSYYSDSVRFYSNDGVYLENLDHGPGTEDPHTLAYDRAGNLHVGARNNGAGLIGVFDPDHDYLGAIGEGMFNPHPLDLAFDLSESLYASTPEAVLKFAADGTFVGSITHPDLDPEGLAFDENEVLYVTNHDASKVFMFNTDGIFQGRLTLDDTGQPSGTWLYGIAFERLPSLDCNDNGEPDACDIAEGASLDCQFNGIPDECELESNDCNVNAVPDDCKIADGSAADCNKNGVPGECEIADETSPDCNENGIPDECEGDCNENGIPDDCDIATGTSSDCNENGQPDECDIKGVNYALYFDGSDDFVQVPRTPDLEPTSMTIEMWVKLDGVRAGNARLLRKLAQYGSSGYILAADSNGDHKMQLRVATGGTLAVADPENHTAYVGEWHHFAATYEATTATFYVDGAPAATVAHTHGPMQHDSQVDLYIGAGLPGPGEYFHGAIDEVRI